MNFFANYVVLGLVWFALTGAILAFIPFEWLSYEMRQVLERCFVLSGIVFVLSANIQGILGQYL